MMQSTNSRSKALDPTLLFLIVFCLIELFGFNSDRFEGSAIIRNLAIPYVDMNLTVVLAAVSIVTVALLMIGGKRGINNVFALLVLRVPLYFLPVLYISGSFQIGIAYAVFQCVFSYYIGYHFSGDLSKIINTIAIFTLGIAAEVYAVLWECQIILILFLFLLLYLLICSMLIKAVHGQGFFTRLLLAARY